jgi:predicted MFS family arabinose efflux permease
MKIENKKLLDRTKFGCLSFMVVLLIIALTSLTVEGFSPTTSFLVVIALCGFLPVYLLLTRISKSE